MPVHNLSEAVEDRWITGSRFIPQQHRCGVVEKYQPPFDECTDHVPTGYSPDINTTLNSYF